MKIATFNVGLLDAWLFGKKIFEFAPQTRVRAKKLPSELNKLDCDVLFLQELYHSADIRKVQENLGETFPYSFHADPPSSRLRLGHGLSVFSKIPIEHAIDTRFNAQLIDEAIVGPKGFISGILKSPEFGDVFFANAHTTAGGFFQHPESAKTDKCRCDQLQQIAATATTNPNAVMSGDLNCGPDVSTEVFDAFLSHGFIRPEHMLGVAGTEPTWDPRNPLNSESPHKTSPPQRIDHILLSKSLAEYAEVTVAHRIFTENLAFEHGHHTLSDHYGIEVHIQRNQTPNSR